MPKGEEICCSNEIPVTSVNAMPAEVQIEELRKRVEELKYEVEAKAEETQNLLLLDNVKDNNR